MKHSAFLALFLCLSMAAPYGCSTRQPGSPAMAPSPRQISTPLIEKTRKSYSQLFDDAAQEPFSTEEIRETREYLKQSKEYCEQAYQHRSRRYAQVLGREAGELMQVGQRIEPAERHDRHCDIQNLRILKARADVLAQQGVAIAFENRDAKLQLLEKWPEEYGRIQQAYSSGEYQNRQWARVEDIGYRQVADGQEDDIRTGQQAIMELRRSGVVGPELEDAEVRDYVTRLTEKLAAHSDLQVPVRVTILNSPEINAFALPGGYLFIQRGLLEAADNEAELAGVISHEIAHAAARHGHKMMRKANVANALLQAARIAGAVAGNQSDAMYYALRYGAAGLGLALNLNLLGKSRNFELEADQLGLQYAWHSGYDVNGFMNFFDKMATKTGYVTGASWFRTHPPFYERMVNVRKEAIFLQNKPDPIVQTDEFLAMKAELKKLPPAIQQDQYGRQRQQQYVPIRTEGCPAPEETVVELNLEPLEEICQLPEEKEPQ